MEVAELPTISIGQDIKVRRDKQGWSQSELARRSGVSQGYISQIEAGTRRPSLQALVKLRDALGLSVEEFASWVDGVAA